MDGASIPGCQRDILQAAFGAAICYSAAAAAPAVQVSDPGIPANQAVQLLA